MVSKLVGLRIVPFVVAVGVLAGCLVGPSYQPPTPTAPQAFKESPSKHGQSDSWTVAKPRDAWLRGKWWELYENPELNDLENQLDINNQNIKQAFESYVQARAMIAQAHAQYFPTVSAGLGFSLARASQNLSGSVATAGSSGFAAISGRVIPFFSLPIDATWEPDLWGKVRNTVHQRQYAAQLSAADLENERLIEQASLAQYYFDIRGQDALRQILNDTVVQDQKALDYTQAQYDTGIGNQISVVEAQNTLDTAKSAAINLGIARAQYEHAVATLIGRPASDFSLPVVPLKADVPEIPVGLPSQLLERRPDVAAAERNMAAANAQIGIGYSAYYPTLTLSLSTGLQSVSPLHLFEWPSRFWSVGPFVSETIFDAGLRRATINQYISIYNANLDAYRQTVLTAFQQVEDGLSTIRLLLEQIQQEQKVVKSSEVYLQLETDRYRTGIDPYVNVVLAQNTLLAARQTLILLQVQMMTASVQLIEALGGGWDKSQLPSVDQVSAPLTDEEVSIHPQ
jgi:NodT family efflux transporter outer membrane factor (OMF) lipoprotein